MQLEPRDKYLLALGGFRRAVHALMEAGAGLQAAAHEFDPSNTAPEEPAAAVISDECLTELRGMCDLLPGVRQLFAAAIGA